MFEDPIPTEQPVDLPVIPDPEPLPLPLPDLPAGAVLVTFQANIGGYPPTTAVLSPRIAQKMARRVNDEGQMVDGVWVPKYTGLTDLIMRHVKETLASDLDARYPDTDQELADLEAQIEARRAALQSQPVFLEG